MSCHTAPSPLICFDLIIVPFPFISLQILTSILQLAQQLSYLHLLFSTLQLDNQSFLTLRILYTFNCWLPSSRICLLNAVAALNPVHIDKHSNCNRNAEYVPILIRFLHQSLMFVSKIFFI